MVLESVLAKIAAQMEWAWMKIILLQWVSETFRTRVRKLEDQFLPPEDEEPKPRSIWDMRKHELEEVAHQELGFPVGSMQGETVRSLRDKIRTARTEAWERLHPEAKIPVGLARMRCEEVAEVCKQRGIPTYDGYVRLTKKQMQARVRQQAAWTLEWARSCIDAAPKPQLGPGCPSMDPDYADEVEWEVTTDPTSAASQAAPSGHLEHC